MLSRVGFRSLMVRQTVVRAFGGHAPPAPGDEARDPDMISSYLPREEVQEGVINVIKTVPKLEETEITNTSHFQNDLGLDSFDTVEIVMALEDEFVIEISDAEAEKIFSTGDAIDYISKHPNAK